MTLVRPLAVITAMGCLCLPATRGWAQNEGQADLDQATELQLSARSMQDLGRVIRLCESALAKGLDEGNAQFAKQLAASALYQRAENLATAILETGQPDPRWPQLRQLALTDLGKALQHQPDLGAAHLLAARLQALPGGDREKALASVNEALRAFGQDNQQRSKALLVRARMTEDPEKQLADYDQAIELDPGNAEAWQARAMFYLDRGEHEKAAEQFARLLEQDNTNAGALHGAAEALTQLGKYEQAVEYLDKVIELEPQSAVAYISRARVYLLMDKDAEAVRDLNQALHVDPGNLAALLLRARAHEAMGKRQLALDDIEQALRLRPNLPQALLLRSMISAAAGKFSAAIADIQLLRREDPKNVELRLQLAAYYSADKRPRRAIELYDGVLAEDAASWRALRGRGDALLSVGKQAEAIQDYETAIKIQPDDSGLLNNLAWVLATSPDQKLRDGKRAIELALKACQATDYKEAHILSTLAAGYAETGDFETARKWSAQAVELGEADVKEQLEAELESYREEKPWRELQQVEEPSLP